MKLLYILLLIPALSFAQLSEQDKELLDVIDSNADILSTNAYSHGLAISDSLLVKYPKDSTILINRVRFLDAYVRKSKCTAYLVPKDKDLCSKALKLYDAIENGMDYKRIAIAKGRVYYNYAIITDKEKDKAAARFYFNKAIDSGELSDYEIQGLKRYLIDL